MKKVLSYSDTVQQYYTFGGFVLILMGILGFVDGIVSIVIRISCLVIIICATLRLVLIKQEKADEMAVQYMDRAKARTMDYMLIAYSILAVISGILVLYIDISIRFTTLILSGTLIIQGVNRAIIGLLFKKYEEE